MNNGLLTGIRNKQPVWWGDQDTDNFGLIHVGIITLGDPNVGYSLPPYPSGHSDGVDRNGLEIVGTNTYVDGITRAFFRIGGKQTYDVVAGASSTGIQAIPVVTAVANMAAIFGILFQPSVGGAGTVTNVYPGWFKTICSAPVTNAWGMRIEFQEAISTLGTYVGLDVYSTIGMFGAITTAIGLRITGLNGSTVWGMQIGNYQSYHQGPLTIGAAAAPVASSVLDLSTTTGALVVPRMTTTQKNALTPLNGMVVYDSTLNKIQCYQGGVWTSLA